MSVILFLVSLFLLWWAFLIVAYQASKWAGEHSRLARLAGLLAFVVAVLDVVWIFSEPARISIAQFVVGAVVATFVVAAVVRIRDARGGRSYGGAGGHAPGGSRLDLGLPRAAGSSGSSSGSGTRCHTCGISLTEVSGGIYDASSLVGAISRSPYPCKSCGTNFCIDCMNLHRNSGGRCPSCAGALGW
jgi:hypothetical protein